MVVLAGQYYAILMNFPESFKREDIAAALVSMVTQDIAQSCHLTAMAHNVKSIYLCGSVVGTSQYLRTQMNMTLAVRGILNSLVGTLRISACTRHIYLFLNQSL